VANHSCGIACYAVWAGERRHQPLQEGPHRAHAKGLIAYCSGHAGRKHYDGYLRLGYGIGSGAEESAHQGGERA